MPNDVNADRLDRLRGDLAALRARNGVTGDATTDDATIDDTTGDDVEGSTPDELEGTTTDGHGSGAPRGDGRGADSHRTASAASRQGRRRPPGPTATRRRTPRPPRPPRRLPRRPARPPRHKVVPTPIPVRPRPKWVAAPRWPTWTLRNGLVVAALVVPAVLQMAYRLLQAIETTSPLLGADPTRIDQLRAAAGVGGGGLTLALTLAALGLVRVRGSHLAGALGVLAVFTLLPHVIHTANAGLASAPWPTLDAMVTPQGWGAEGLLTLAFWLAVAAFVLAAGDLLQRSLAAMGTLRRR